MSEDHDREHHRSDHGDHLEDHSADLDAYLDSEIDADLDEDRWGPPNGLGAERWREPWDRPWEYADASPPGPRRRVTHLVLVDGLPADHWVDESPDGTWSRRTPPLRGPGIATALDPPHLRELRWLDTLVGGRSSLLSLDTAGLVAPTKVSLPRSQSDAQQQAVRAEAIRATCARHARLVFHDPEMPAAAHHALEAALRADPAFLLRSTRDDTAAGAILWVAGHANGHIGPTGDILARDLWERIGVSSSAGSRGSTLLPRLRSARGLFAGTTLTDETPPPGAPRLKATGHSSILTSATRTLIADRRDAALAAMAS